MDVSKDVRAWPLLLLVLLAAGCGGTKTVVQTTTVRVTTQETPPSATACTGDAMTGSFTVVPGSGAAGQISYRLHVTNAAPVACFVSGLPNVQLLDQGGRDL